jgi:hypothetical protein
MRQRRSRHTDTARAAARARRPASRCNATLLGVVSAPAFAKPGRLDTEFLTQMESRRMVGVNYPDRPATTILAGGGGGIFG